MGAEMAHTPWLVRLLAPLCHMGTVAAGSKELGAGRAIGIYQAALSTQFDFHAIRSFAALIAP